MTARIYRNAPYTRSDEVLNEAPKELVYRGVPYVRKQDGSVSSNATLVYRGQSYNNLARMKRVLDKAERLSAARMVMAKK